MIATGAQILTAWIDRAEQLLKDDLVTALEQALEGNESTYAKQRAFADYYSYARNGSPIKRERSSPEALTVTKTRTRRQTLTKPAER